MEKDSETAASPDKKHSPNEMLEAATNLMIAVARGTVIGYGKGLSVLGTELEKFGEQLKSSDK